MLSNKGYAFCGDNTFAQTFAMRLASEFMVLGFHLITLAHVLLMYFDDIKWRYMSS